MVELSILIPTYNRSDSVARLLGKLSKLDSHLVEVIVSNNHSTDGTLETLEGIRANWKSKTRLSLHHQESNQGFDGNLATLLNMAEGRYVYFLSDDDVPRMRHLKKLIKTLGDSEASVLISHHFARKRSAKKHFSNLNVVPLSLSPLVTKLEIGEISPIQDAGARAAILLLCGQISSAIYRRPESGLDELCDSMKVHGGGVPQFLLANTCLQDNPKYLISEKSWVRIGAKKGFSDWFVDSSMFGAPVVLANLHDQNQLSRIMAIYQATEYANWSLNTFSEIETRLSASKNADQLGKRPQSETT